MKPDSKKPAPKEIPTTIKGVRDIMGETYYNYQGFFEKAQEIAVYYGFRPIEMPILEQVELYNRGIGEGTDIMDKEMYSLKTKGGDHLALRPEGTAGIVRAYIEHGMQSEPQPVMLYYYGPFFRHDKPQRGRYRELRQFGLEILGSPKSIADALIISTTYTVLKAMGATGATVDINSMGDKESRTLYTKALTGYYKKFVNQLPVVDRNRLKTNPLRILDSKEPKTIEINVNAPDALSYLNPVSKKHFKEVLEFLDEMEIPYRINKNLVRGLDYYTHTVFEIFEEQTDELVSPLTIAAGGRYDNLAKSLGYKKELPGVGVGIGVDRVLEASWCKHLSPKIIKKPKFCFIQLGFDAKLKSLSILEILREAKIPIQQSLSKDSLGAQLGIAEKLGVPYTLIFGQKEALDKTVIVRDMNTRSQEIIPIEKLAQYLKHIK
ncbi:MAG: histidine--tRNA ligase [Candidatus Pacebacteria bacterium]|nr:histidine--tRNA ligase [Candidatus Paceibacterota bacterium]